MLDFHLLIVLARNASSTSDSMFDLITMSAAPARLRWAIVTYLSAIHHMVSELLYFLVGNGPIGSLDEHFPDCSPGVDVEVGVVN